ncbi:NmrA family NAD(P)-binding protein [Spirosoma arcticum]
MNIVVTGSLGNISKPLTEELVQNGHSVTVISSKPDKRTAIEALGATAAIGSLEDAHFLTETFAGADAVYCMIPPNFAAPDQLAHYQATGRSYAQAIRQSGIKRVVHLSSWGAHLAKGTGFIVGSHHVEEMLNELSDVSITHLRAGYIYYNLYNYMGMIKSAGMIGANYGGDDTLVLVAPADIATAAAEELTTPTTGHTIRYVASDERTANEIAHSLGAAIGKPDLHWVTFTDEQLKSSMEQRGLPAHIIANSMELGNSIHNGTLRENYDRHKPAGMGKVKLDDFSREFAAALQKG